MRSATSERRSDRWLERGCAQSAAAPTLGDTQLSGNEPLSDWFGRPRVLVPLEMFGARHRIQIAKPFRRAPVQLASFDHPDEAATGVLVTFAR